ncbi:protein OS-9-like isoform X2 [Patiria miniata]|uniref:Protein OS-9 n=1 Tax=Patiria miniata TaxID=46514 RepID=A0A913Z243_PATMI|nr:protein OS-9-like isoform X2 [Patiria miniata]
MAKLTWERCFLVFCCSFSLFCSNIFAFLDLEELKSVHYDIDILSTPVLLGRPVQQEVMHLRSKFGQQYECQLPDMTDYEKDQEEEKLATDMGISELLKPMENAPCLVKTKDWWSYEYCHGQHVKQYHLEDGNVVGDDLYLGYYESEMDWNNKTHKDAKRHRLNRYHSHTYVNGTKCDLTKKPRETEVRFLCAEGQGDSIFRIDEPSSCAYILTIHTSRTCHHPYLRPPPSLKARPVLCYPALEQEQYEKYLEIKQEKQEKDKKNEQHMIAIGTSEGSQSKDSSVADGASTPTQEPSTSQETPARKTPFESALFEDLDQTEVNIDGLEEAMSMGVDPTQLSNLVKSILNSVKDDVKSIDKEVKDKSETGEDSSETKELTREIDDDDDDDDDFLEKLALSDLDMEGMLDDPELQSLMEEDIGELVSRFRRQISQVTSDPVEAAQMHKMLDSIEATLKEIDTVNSLIDETDGDDDDDSDDDDDDENDGDDAGRMLAKTLKNLINEVREKSEENKMADLKKPSTSLSAADAGGKGQVKLKVTKVSLDRSRKAKQDSPKETMVYDNEHRPIEEAIMQQLENAGVNADGKIEFRIVTYSPNEWPGDEEEDGVTILTEEESNYFKNVVMGLLGGGAETTEQQRQRRLENNYQFTWDSLGTAELGTSSALGTDATTTDAEAEESEP